MNQGHPTLGEFQRDFAAYLRHPTQRPPPGGMAERPARLYADLLFNNISAALDSCLPISRNQVDNGQWREIQRSYFRDARPQTPLLWEIPGEFAEYLAENRDRYELPPWVPELAHFEWMELAVETHDVPYPNDIDDGDLLAMCPVANPTANLLAYCWPVQDLVQGAKPPIERRPSLLIIWRDLTETVRFEQVSPAAARIFELIEDGGNTGQVACEQLARELSRLNLPQLNGLAAGELERMRASDLIIGCRPR